MIGTARRPWSHEEFRENIKDSIHSFVGADEQIDDFSSHFYYQPHDVTDSDSYIQLKTLAEELDTKYSLQGNRIFYLAMAPEFLERLLII